MRVDVSVVMSHHCFTNSSVLCVEPLFGSWGSMKMQRESEDVEPEQFVFVVVKRCLSVNELEFLPLAYRSCDTLSEMLWV